MVRIGFCQSTVCLLEGGHQVGYSLRPHLAEQLPQPQLALRPEAHKQQAGPGAGGVSDLLQSVHIQLVPYVFLPSDLDTLLAICFFVLQNYEKGAYLSPANKQL